MEQNTEHLHASRFSDDVLQKVLSIISTLLSSQEGEMVNIESSERLESRGGLSSLVMAQLVLELEKQFNIQFGDADLSLEALDTPEKIANIVRSHLKRS